MRWRWPVGVVHSKTPGPVWVRWNPPSVLTWWSRLQSGPRLVALVVPSSRWNSTVWSRSQDSAGAGHPGRAQARSRTWMWVARSAVGHDPAPRPVAGQGPGRLGSDRSVPGQVRGLVIQTEQGGQGHRHADLGAARGTGPGAGRVAGGRARGGCG